MDAIYSAAKAIRAPQKEKPALGGFLVSGLRTGRLSALLLITILSELEKT